jgi:sulfur relay (sulfurtransferase) complex TusBCD TusD component (DsrE family)
VTRAEERSLGILLTRGPGTEEARWAIALARSGARAGIAVRLFLMADGVDLLGEEGARELAEPGVAVSACSQTVIARGLPTGHPHVDYASQHRLARIVAGSDRFVSL